MGKVPPLQSQTPTTNVAETLSAEDVSTTVATGSLSLSESSFVGMTRAVAAVVVNGPPKIVKAKMP